MRILGSLVLDLVLVAVFAVIGRASHAESLDLAGIATTAWPFAVSVALGSVVASWRNWPWWVQGIFVWVVALVGGISLAVFLIGWRAILRKRLTTAIPVPAQTVSLGP